MKEISAGGVVYRKVNNQLEIMLIEDRYTRWSLPKGKLEQDETTEQAALREIEEETGIVGQIVAPLEVIYYQYYHPKHGQIDKEVHYYLVEELEGELQPQISEINLVQWVSPLRAWELHLDKGYENNDVVLQKALAHFGINVPGRAKA